MAHVVSMENRKLVLPRISDKFQSIYFSRSEPLVSGIMEHTEVPKAFFAMFILECKSQTITHYLGEVGLMPSCYTKNINNEIKEVKWILHT